MLQLVLGLMFWLLAIHTWRSRPKPGAPRRDPKILRRLDRLPATATFGLGLLEGMAIIKNVPLAIAAGARLSQSTVDGAAAVLAVPLCVALASITLIGPLVAMVVGGDRVREPLVESKQWLLDNLTPIALVVLVVLGSTMVGRGLGGLS